MRIAIIGAGIFVRETYVPNFIANAGRVQLTAVLSRSAGPIDEIISLYLDGTSNSEIKIHKFVGAGGESAFFSQAREICDAVVIAVPIPLLGHYIERCLAIGLSILSEKPVAMNSTEAQRLIAFYEQQNIPGLWHVAENYRLEPAVAYASNLVRSHSSSPKAFALTAIRQQTPTAKYAVTPWRVTPEYAGSFVLDGGIHFIAMLRAVLPGQVTDIQAIYQENSVVEVGSCGACRVGDALGTFHIRYGLFSDVVCKLEVYWDDAIMTITQIKGVGYDVVMTGKDTQRFKFGGLQVEFTRWLDSFSDGRSPPIIIPELTPDESLLDLLVVEKMCQSLPIN